MNAGAMEERFDSKWVPHPETGCWLWIDAPNGRGYADLWDGEKNSKAHRFSYELFVGPIPDGLVIDHLCRVRNCVNPAHLEPVTNAENLRRGLRARTHCRNGHPLTPENTSIVRRRSGRKENRCKICHRQRNAASKARTA